MKKIFTSSDNFPWHGKQRLAGKLPDGVNKPLQLICKSQRSGNPDPALLRFPPLLSTKPEFKDTVNVIDQSDSELCRGQQQGEGLC